MTSGFAKLFVLAALLYAALTAGELWETIQMAVTMFDSEQSKIFQVSAALGRWAIDPIFLCGTAVMIEFLERIWRELAKTNRDQAPSE